MALLPILCYPDPRLHPLAKPVPVVDARVRQLVADMLETIRSRLGIQLDDGEAASELLMAIRLNRIMNPRPADK